MLEFNSLNALRHEPSASNHAIRLEPDLADAEISGSAVTANALILLRRAADTGGLKLTATGNLSRAVVEEMFGIVQVADYDKAELLRFQKVVNEPDFLPLHFIRILTQAAKLIRTHRGTVIFSGARAVGWRTDLPGLVRHHVKWDTVGCAVAPGRAFLLAPVLSEASYVTGVTLPVAGGDLG
jgi:hypothetical protein